MNDLSIPNLTFQMVLYGTHETPWDLRPFLYRGGAGANTKLVEKQIAQGTLGPPLLDRLPLVEKLHEHIEGKLAGGGSRNTAKHNIRLLRSFFAWADKVGRTVTLESVEGVYIEWADHLIHRHRVGEISDKYVYQKAVVIAKVFDDVLERRVGLLTKTRIRRSNYLRPVLGTQADKQNLEHTFAFGHVLLDITDALSVEGILGPLPVTIRFRTGQVIEEWLRLKPPELVKSLRENTRPFNRRRAIAKRAAWEADTSLRTRFPLVNLRIQAEMLIFIAQTGMNLEQVHTLKMCKFRYQSHLDGYQVYRVYKGRRHGEVAFEIFSQYREVFERYLVWRAAIFPGDDEGLLFPLVRNGRALAVAPELFAVEKLCKKLGVRFVPPRVLRKTRINWLLRRSHDPAMTAEMHAHTQETLIRIYEQPNLQVAMVEISRFHARTNPAIVPPGPGECVEAVPQAVPDAPPEATTPDCISPAGCLFCVHQRDIDTEDYVWSLASYRYLKSLELACFRPSAKRISPHPVIAAIDRVTAKLKYFEQSSEVRRLWVRESLARVEEEHHHPRWDGFIRLLEVRI